MKTMEFLWGTIRRRAWNTITVLSLVLCLAVVALWYVDYGNTPPRSRIQGIFNVFDRSVGVGAGGFSVRHYRKLPQPRAVAGTNGMIDLSLYGRACGDPWEWLGVRYKPSASWSSDPKTPLMLVGVYDAWAVEYWWATAVSSVLPILWLGALGWRYLRGHRHIPGTCRKCGYDLRASKERCPECGTAMPLDSAGRCETKAV